MMARYNPDDYEPKEFIEIPEGDYPFAVVNATETVSKKGNDMIEMELQFNVKRQEPLTVYDRLVFTSKALFMVEGFCSATGHDWSKGELTDRDCIGKKGTARLVLGPPKEQGKSAGKRFMEVKWYCRPKGYEESPVSQQNEPVTATSSTHDDIPF